jgi:hypothetical protein
MDWIADVIALLALVLSGLGFFDGRRRAAAAGRSAQAAAADARRAADAVERTAKATEEQAELARIAADRY